ncbi:hypothetical protein HY498_02340 [Candidatus Woesearchaeota archaeon]|nr:hypothetical protein [Candidatus Woesearchaeota archaeon]
MVEQTQQRTLEQLTFSLGDNSEIIRMNGELIKAIPIGEPYIFIFPMADSTDEVVTRRVPNNANAYCVGMQLDASRTREAPPKIPYQIYAVQYYKIIS